MIFGFNTDIKHEDVVYHVQSEARHADLLLQTQVFVRGRCIGKHATSYADWVVKPDFSDEQMHELLKIQHKNVIDTIRAGNVATLFAPTQMLPREGAEIQDASQRGEGLSLHWLNQDAVYQDNSILMKFKVTRQGQAVPGARLTSRLHVASDAPVYSETTTDDQGLAEMKISLDESALPEAAVLVQATFDSRQSTRKFRLKRQTTAVPQHSV
jgi:hypothetical protein